MSWPNIDPQLLTLFLDGGEELARWAWHHLNGDSSSADAKKKIDAIRRKGIEAFVKAMQDETEQQAQVANLAIQLAKLGPLAEHVLAACDHVDGSIPKLGLDIEEVALGDLPPQQSLDTIDE